MPPQLVVCELNKLIADELSKYDATITNGRLLVKEARKAREARQFKRALKLARRALIEDPQDAAAGSVHAPAFAV